MKMFDDDGNEINSDLLRKPSLCISCVKDDNPVEEMLCKLMWLDQDEDDADFECHAYKPKSFD